MKKILKFLTIVIVIGVIAGMVFAFVKTDKFLDSLKFMLPFADKMHLTRFSKYINIDLYNFLNKGYLLNNPKFTQSNTAYVITCIIGVIVLIIGGAGVSAGKTIKEKTQIMGVLCVFFAALFGLDFVLAVIMIGLVTWPFAG